MINKLFQNISMKFRNENAVSDLTWCMCETSENFKTHFLKFFFPNVDFHHIEIFQREFSLDDSRPDFYIKTAKDEYLIEVKLLDRNQHFEQYERTFNIPKENLGYITNYKMYKDEFEVKTWREFYDYLEEKLSDIGNEKELYTGYLLYLKNVCSIIKIKEKMNLKNTYSLFTFNQILKEVLERETSDYRLEIYQHQINDQTSGYYFKVSDKTNKKEDIWLWIGIQYSSEIPEVWVEVDNKINGGKPFFDIIKGKESKARLEDGVYNFYFEKRIEEFNDLLSLEEQKKVLITFIDETLQVYLK